MRSGFTTQTVPGSQVDASSGTAVITSTEVLPQSEAVPVDLTFDPWDTASPVNLAQIALDEAVKAHPDDRNIDALANALRHYRLLGVEVTTP